MGRFFFPKFDGSSKCSTKSWVEKIYIYFQLKKVPKIEAIKIASLQFEGEEHNWWFHGLSTLGHANVTTYSEFTRRLVERFHRRDPQATFMSLAMLKQSGNTESYISEFLILSIMVPNLSAARRVYMFIDGLDEPLHGLFKSTKPTTLHDAIDRARDLQDAFPKENENFQHKPSFPSKGKEEKTTPSKESSYKKPLDDHFRKDIRRNLCFTCQDSWEPGHRCDVGKAHYI